MIHSSLSEFAALRSRARDRRDKEIAAAQAEYESALVQINALEKALASSRVRSPRYKKISACIDSVIPNRPFTVDDVRIGLQAIDPGRVWRIHSIHAHMRRLRTRNVIRRLKRCNRHEGAVYVKSDIKAEIAPTGDQTLSEIMSKVLAGRRLRLAEVVVAVLEAGYKTTMKPDRFQNTVRHKLRMGKFTNREGKWSAG